MLCPVFALESLGKCLTAANGGREHAALRPPGLFAVGGFEQAEPGELFERIVNLWPRHTDPLADFSEY